MNDESRFSETQLPSKESFYSKLTEKHINDDEYERALQIWKRFNIKNLGEYHDLYLMTDVLLLADIFENFRDMCLETYKLDPAYYITLPNFAWDAMLKYTNVQLDLVYDLEMYQMLEKGKRGGMCGVSHKHAIANNQYLSNYDENTPSSYITDIDANNLYGLAMSMKLPKNDLQWCQELPTEKDIKQYDDDCDFGYILEVDLEYPT